MMFGVLLFVGYIYLVVKFSRMFKKQERKKRMTTDPLCATCGHASTMHVLDRVSMDTMPDGGSAIRWRFRCSGTPALSLGCPCFSFKLSAQQVKEMQSPSPIS